ncbi:MAG: hypothetical protein ACRDPO_34890 [Streptosporangiaceae bacterium]
MVTVQVLPGLPAVSGLLLLAPLTAALGLGLGVALGLGAVLDVVLGVVLACASPESMSMLAAVMTIKAGHRPMPSGRFRSTWDLLGRSGIAIAARLRGRLWSYLFGPVTTTMSERFAFYACLSSRVRQERHVGKSAS